MIGFIYKLYCLDDNIKDCYIGSCWDIKKRLTDHKSYCTNINGPKYNYKVYKCIRANGGWFNWKYEYYQTDVVDADELHQIEQGQMDIQDSAGFPILNDHKAYTGLTKKQYDKQYRIDNKDYYIKQNTCHCGGTYTQQNLPAHLDTIMHKEYIKQKKYNQKYYTEYGKSRYIANKQHYIESATKSYIKNKDHLNKKINCKCGGKYTYKNKKRHLESIKHRGYEIIIQA